MHKLILSTLSLIALLMCLHHIPVSRILSWILTLTLLFLSSASYASPPPSTDVHFCKVFDYEEIRARNSRYAATKHALDLNVGEPRTVRMIYFLPNDRPFRQEVVDSMKVTIRQIQTFFSDQMEAHGHGRKTFRFETDAQGEPVVHRVDGQHPESHYLSGAFPDPNDEIYRSFDPLTNINFVVLENSTRGVGGPGGVGAEKGKNGGYALVSGEFHWQTVAHELGHAFGLPHDWRDGDYIMSYGANGGRLDRLSACAAEFLAVHTYFNPDSPIEETPPPTIELISSPGYPTGSKSISIQLKVSDPDGLHQVILFVGYGIKACRGLNGETEAVVQFDYDGVIPSSSDPHGTGTNLSNPSVHNIYVEAVDTGGDVGITDFNLFDISTQRNLIATLEGHKDGVNSIAFSPDGATLASGSWDATVKLWDIATRTNIATITGHTGRVYSVSFSPDGTTLASGSGDGTVKLWDVATGTNIATIAGHTSWVTSVSFSPDGATLASGSWDATVKLWDIATRTNIATITGHTGRVYSVSFSPDGTTLASGSGDGTVKLWDVATGTNIATIAGHTSWVTSVSFSPDGATLASGSWDATVKLWDIATRTNIATITGHTGRVYSVSFSPDGTTLASGSGDGTVKLWDVATGTNIATIAGHTGWITSVSFSPDGATLASGSADGSVKLWDTSEYLRPRPFELVKISGDNQQGTPDVALANPLVVEVKDQNGDVLEGITVTFTVTAGGGMVSTTTDTTDASGRAQTTLTLGSDAGTNTVSVTVTEIDQPVAFTGEAVVATPDFDGDGAVNIADFLLFVGQFGFSQADEGYEARFDLDGDGVIGIGDFLIFVDNFGNAGS